MNTDHPPNLVSAVLDAAAQTSSSTMVLRTRDGIVLHQTAASPETNLRSVQLTAPDGTTLLLESDLPRERLETVAELLRQAISTHFELSETKEDLGRSRQELSLLYEFSRSVMRVSTVEAVVERFLYDIVNVLDAKEGTLLGIEEETSSLHVVCHYGSTPQTISEFALPMGRGIAGKVAEDGIPRLVNDTASDPDYIPGVNPIRNVICAPIRIAGEIVGVVSVNDRQNDLPFEPSHLKLLSSLAQLGEVGLENARLFGQVRGLLFKVVDGLVKLLEGKSPQSVGHSRRVARLAYSLGRHIGIARRDLEKLFLAALVHDLGAPSESSSAGDSPWLGGADEAPNHMGTTLGAIGILETAQELTRALPGLADFRIPYDGSKDPKGPRGNRISLEGRIIAVAHAFDSAFNGPKGPSLSPSQALTELKKHAGTLFDPDVVHSFSEIYDSLRLDGWVPPTEDDVPWQSAGRSGSTDEET